MARVLIAWIGKTDLKASSGADVGPIGQAVAARTFDHIVLLNNMPKDEAAEYDRCSRASAVNTAGSSTNFRLDGLGVCWRPRSALACPRWNIVACRGASTRFVTRLWT